MIMIFFAIRSIDAFSNYLVLTPTEMNLYTALNINANDLENVGSIKISGFEASNFFIKTDGSIDENDYITASDPVMCTSWIMRARKLGRAPLGPVPAGEHLPVVGEANPVVSTW